MFFRREIRKLSAFFGSKKNILISAIYSMNGVIFRLVVLENGPVVTTNEITVMNKLIYLFFVGSRCSTPRDSDNMQII